MEFADIDYEIAYAAHRNTSHVPDERARQAQDGFRRDVQQVYDDIWAICTTKEQQEIAEREMQRFATEYKAKYEALLTAQSRTASPAITGPANFNSTRNQKRIDAEDRKRQKMLEWYRRAISAIRNAVLAARPPEQVQAEDLHAFEDEITRRLRNIREIDNGQSTFDRSGFVQNLVSAVERRAMNGEVDLVARAIAMVQEHNASASKPVVTDRHRFWQFSEIAQQKREEQNASVEDERWGFEGGYIELDNQAERVRIVFDGKPDEERRARLRGAGWRWSPTNGAWQRKLTQAAVMSAKGIVGKG